jgi:hypothetical protein
VTGGRHPDFFISYTAADRAWAEWIAWQLEDAGYRVLVQAWDFIPGSNWTVRMQQGVAEAARTIALLSDAYLKSVYGRAEWQAAQAVDPLGFAGKLIPIRIADCSRPGLLGQIVSFDLFGLPEVAAAARLAEQVAILRVGRAKPAAAPPFLAAPAAPPTLSGPEPAFPGTPSDPAESTAGAEAADVSTPGGASAGAEHGRVPSSTVLRNTLARQEKPPSLQLHETLDLDRQERVGNVPPATSMSLDETATEIGAIRIERHYDAGSLTPTGSSVRNELAFIGVSRARRTSVAGVFDVLLMILAYVPLLGWLTARRQRRDVRFHTVQAIEIDLTSVIFVTVGTIGYANSVTALNAIFGVGFILAAIGLRLWLLLRVWIHRKARVYLLANLAERMASRFASDTGPVRPVE